MEVTDDEHVRHVERMLVFCCAVIFSLSFTLLCLSLSWYSSYTPPAHSAPSDQSLRESLREMFASEQRLDNLILVQLRCANDVHTLDAWHLCVDLRMQHYDSRQTT